MENIDKNKLKNRINNLIFNQSYQRYILRCSLDDLNLTDEEMKYAIKYINNLNINLVNYEITKKDRTTSVDEYNYGYVSGYEINYLDMPVWATLEYNDNGNLIYSDYSKLDEYIEKYVIPTYICKDNYNDNYYLKLSDILKFLFSEDEFRYVMEYLSKQDIEVRGFSNTFYSEFSNFNNELDYKGLHINRNVDVGKIHDMLRLYKKNPTKELRNKIIELNMNLVKVISFNIAKSTDVSVFDLESYGYLGLIDAIEGYDIKSGLMFSTYAYRAISRKIIRGAREFLAFDNQHVYNKYYNARLRTELDTGERLHENIKMVDDIVNLMAENKIIDKKNISNNKARILLTMPEPLDNYTDNECLIDDNSLELAITKNEVYEILKRNIKKLSERQQFLLIKYYGLDNSEEMTLEQLSQICGICCERVRIIIKDTLEKLKINDEISNLKDYLSIYDNYKYYPNRVIEYQNTKKKVKKRKD